MQMDCKLTLAIASEKCVVLGAGIAGMLTAGVASKHFRNVSVIEKRSPPSQSGIELPQAPHGHIFFESGQRIVERIFPEYRERYKNNLPIIDLSADTVWHTPMGEFMRYPSEHKIYSASRTYINNSLEELLKCFENVNVEYGTRVSDIVFDKKLNRIKSVVVKNSNKETELRTDLVIDATGVRGLGREFLSKGDFALPNVSIVPTKISYSSFRATLSASFDPGYKMIFVQRIQGKDPHATLAMQVEKGDWVITLVDGDGNIPGGDYSELLKYAAHVRTPEVFRLLKHANPITQVSSYSIKANTRYRYGDMPDWPQGLIIVGDAVARFNPVYGQGMTTAAFAAELLADSLIEMNNDRFLNKNTPRAYWERNFQQALDNRLNQAWMLSTSQDNKSSRTGFKSKVKRVYLDHLASIALKDKVVHQGIIQVTQLSKPLHTLVHPSILYRALI